MSDEHKVEYQLDNHLTLVAYFCTPSTSYEEGFVTMDDDEDRVAQSKLLSSDNIEGWRKSTTLAIDYWDGSINADKTHAVKRIMGDICLPDVRIINGAEALELVRGQETSSELLPNHAVVVNENTLKKDFRPNSQWVAFIDPYANWTKPGTKVVLFRDHCDMDEYVYEKAMKKLIVEQNKVLIEAHGNDIARPLDGNKIERLRTEEGRNYSQSELARRAGISRVKLIGVENNENVSIDVLMKIARACNKTLKISFE